MKSATLAINMLTFLTLFCTGCTSIPARADLRRNADEMFNNLEKAERAKSQSEVSSHYPLNTPKQSADWRTFKFEETGSWRMSKAESPSYAETQAENDALGKALRSSGAETYYGFSDVQGELNGRNSGAVARYLQVWSKGVLKWERLGKAEFHPTAEGITCIVRIKGTVTFRGEPDPAFEIKLHVGGKELGLSRTVLKDGEVVQFSAMLTKDAYLHIISVDQAQNAYLVYPNAYSGVDRIPAGEVIQFPQPGSGVALQAALPPGATEATEAVHVIATKSTPLFTESDLSGAEGSMLTQRIMKIMGRLAKVKRSEWTMVVLPYQIVK